MSAKETPSATPAKGKSLKPKSQRIGSLKTLGDVATELGKLYRLARKGEVESIDASRFASILGELRQVLTLSAVEERLRALEEMAGERKGASVTSLRTAA